MSIENILNTTGETIESSTLHPITESSPHDLNQTIINQEKDEHMLDVPPEEDYHARYHGFTTVTDPIDFGTRTTISSNYRTVWKDHITLLQADKQFIDLIYDETKHKHIAKWAQSIIEILLSTITRDILYPLEDLFIQDFSPDSLRETTHGPSARNLVTTCNRFDENTHGIILEQLRDIVRTSLTNIFKILKWNEVFHKVGCHYSPTSNKQIKEIYDACGVRSNAKLYALPIEAQMAIVLKVYDATGVIQPNAQLLKLAEHLNGQAYLEHRKTARLTVDSATTYIINAISETAKLTTEELRFLVILRHIAYPLSELSAKDAIIIMKENMTEFLNKTVNNNFQFNAEALQRVFTKAERKTQFRSVNPHQSTLFYPAGSDDYFKSKIYQYDKYGI